MNNFTIRAPDSSRTGRIHAPVWGAPMKGWPFVLQQPEQLSLRHLDLTEAETRMWSSTSNGRHHSRGADACTGPATQPDSPAWDIRWCPASRIGWRITCMPAPSGARRWAPRCSCLAKVLRRCVRVLFGGAASSAAGRARSASPMIWANGALALAATARHVSARDAARHPDRSSATGCWAPDQRALRWQPGMRRRCGKPAGIADAALSGDRPASDVRHDYRHLRCQRRCHYCWTSISRLAPDGEVVLAGFTTTPFVIRLRAAFCAGPSRGCAMRDRGGARDWRNPYLPVAGRADHIDTKALADAAYQNGFLAIPPV